MNRVRVIMNLLLALALLIVPLQGTFAAPQPMHDDAVVALHDEQGIAHPACAAMDTEAEPGLDCVTCTTCATCVTCAALVASFHAATQPLADDLVVSSASFLKPHDPTRELRPPENLLV